MSMLEAYEKYRNICDKGRVHSYIQNFYRHHLERYKDREVVIAEVGVFHGGSIRLYYDYFTRAKIYGIDTAVYDADFARWCEDKENVKYIIGNGYGDEIVTTLPGIDIFIDDGPHSLDSQLAALKKYLPKMTKGGIFIIEDIQNDLAMRTLYTATPDALKAHTYPLDYRFDRNRYDDRLFVIKLPE